MYNIQVHIILYFVMYIFSSIVTSSGSISIKVNGTIFIGKKGITIYGKNPYSAFWKIPYAEPPIGNLRFKSPKPNMWPRHVINNFSIPYENTCFTNCNEDCLYLSIYMPLKYQNDHHPVVVWIHKYSHQYTSDFLIDEGIIIVTVSYRTSIFGFLNTGDSFAEGNMGAKDVILALRWIRNNIFIFHGDQNRVTVVGTQSSANLVSSLLLTSASEDLFSRAIIQSGSALSPADYRSYSFEISNKLYWKLNCPLKKFNRTKLYEILSNASITELLLASEELFDSTEIRDCQRLINSFGLTVERTKKGAFMNKFPLEVYKSRLANNDVEVMLGYTSLESLYKLKGFVNNRKLLKYLNYNFQYLLPFEGRRDKYESKRYKKIRRKIMDFYFVNGTIKERSLRRYTKYVSDQVIYPLIRQARLHTGVSFNNVYLYRFSFKGSLSVVWNTSVRNLNWGGATGGDEICYQFRCKSVDANYESAEPSERRFIKKIARLLANFARFGNPTPDKRDDLLGRLKWQPLHPRATLMGLNLGRTIKMVEIPEIKRIDFWDNLKKEFFGDDDNDDSI